MIKKFFDWIMNIEINSMYSELEYIRNRKMYVGRFTSEFKNRNYTL